MKLVCMAPTYPPWIFAPPIRSPTLPTPRELRWRWSRWSSSNWPLISGFQAAPFFTHRWKKYGNHYYLDFNPWDEKNGWVPPLESDILVIQGHASWNSQSNLLLKWFTKTMIEFVQAETPWFKKSSLFKTKTASFIPPSDSCSKNSALVVSAELKNWLLYHQKWSWDKKPSQPEISICTFKEKEEL